jgi:hypothetical protein
MPRQTYDSVGSHFLAWSAFIFIIITCFIICLFFSIRVWVGNLLTFLLQLLTTSPDSSSWRRPVVILVLTIIRFRVFVILVFCFIFPFLLSLLPFFVCCGLMLLLS